MKTAKIFKTATGYEFKLFVDNEDLGFSKHHPTKKECLEMIENHFESFKIDDQTGENDL